MSDRLLKLLSTSETQITEALKHIYGGTWNGNPRPTEIFIRKHLTDGRGLNWLVQIAASPVILGAETAGCFPHQSVALIL
jgi:hypothetical protein